MALQHRVARLLEILTLVHRDGAPRPRQRLTESPDGSLSLHVVTAGLHEIAWWVVQYGGDAAIIQPRELRDMVCSMARAILTANAAQAPQLSGDNLCRVAEDGTPYGPQP